jgi:hypothetical protein
VEDLKKNARKKKIDIINLLKIHAAVVAINKVIISQHVQEIQIRYIDFESQWIQLLMSLSLYLKISG